jgi:DNA polymerase I
VNNLRIRIFPVDITYGIVNNEPEIRVFGVSEDGKHVAVAHRGFRPYFYAILSNEEAVSELRRMRNVISIEIEERKLFGKPVKVAKIIVTTPDKVRDARERAATIKGVQDVLEADIRFTLRYMIDKGIKPGWMEFEAEPSDGFGTGIDAFYRATSDPVQVESTLVPPLRYVAFDIEVYNPFGSPSPERDPIIIISMMDWSGNIKLLVNDGDEGKLIRDFVRELNELNPDILFGYNSSRFDLPYLVRRASVLGVKLPITKYGTAPEQSTYGHWSIIGRAHIDLYGVIQEMSDIKRKSLDYAAEYFGVMKRSERVLIPGHDIHRYWDDASKRDELLKYARDDAVSTLRLGEKLLPHIIQLANISGLPLDQVVEASVGARVEWMIMHEAYRAGELAPNRVEREYEPYRGAIVLEPRPGLHNNVAVLDFSSMYPSIMMRFNVSPDTLMEGECDCYVAPEVGYRFLKSPRGLYPRMLEKLVSARRSIREQMRLIEAKSPEFIYLDARQRALKIMANAMYGYCGWTGARWYRREVAEAVTAWGRSLLTSAIKFAESIGGRVIYGDTDSLFLLNDEGVISKLIEKEEKDGFEVKIDKVYDKLLLTESKKRYIGLLPNGDIDIVGFEAARGDWCDLAKDVQEEVAELVLKRGTNAAIEYVRGIIKKLREHSIDLNSLIIWKTLDKSIDEYKVIAPHVAAARKLIERGFRVGKGDQIGFVVVKGEGRLADRVVPIALIKGNEDIDIDYYVEKQVIPAAMRILEPLGVNESALREKRGGGSILDFLG